jgi:hypothetical protein
MSDIDEIALNVVKAIAEIDPDKLPGGRTQAIAQAQILVRDAIACGARAPGLPWIPVQFCLPKLRTVTRKTPNGILVRFNNGNIRHLWEVTETLLHNMRNGPRQPKKFEAQAPARITHWLDLDEPEKAGGDDA